MVVEERSKRVYPLGTFLGHLLGHVGEINQRELERLSGEGYRSGDVIGRMGVERLKEEELRGRRGGSMVETDALGRIVKEIAKVPASNGQDVYLTIDYRLQEIVEAEFEGLAGAVVCMEPHTGQVLAMMSAPGFDPNLFVNGISLKAWEGFSKDPERPLLNRAVAGLYPLGSVFKVVMAIAALEEGLTDEKETVYCPGSYSFGNREFRCWKEWGHGPVNLRRALVESCDVYFYEMGRRLGIDKIAHWAKLLGLGVNSGSGLIEEKEGVIPSTEWKRKALKAPWYPGETISCAIGQGYIQVSPLQVARMMSAVFNGGYLLEVKLSLDEEEQKRIRLPIKERTLDLVREALWGVVNEPRGTGTRARVEGWDVCGKTGTAQTRSVNIVEKDIEKVPYHLRDHAWFASVAPKEDPRIVVVVLVEHGGHGGSAAAPIAGRIIERYLQGD
jgi:penicillin-binding protein 2